MRTVVTFSHKEHQVPGFETPDVPGKEVIELLKTWLTRRGYQCEQAWPDTGVGGWFLWFSARSEKFRGFLNSAGVGSPMKDCWVVSFFQRRRGFLNLFSKQDHSGFARVLEDVDEALHEEEDCDDIQWWDENSFVRELQNPGSESGHPHCG